MKQSDSGGWGWGWGLLSLYSLEATHKIARNRFVSTTMVFVGYSSTFSLEVKHDLIHTFFRLINFTDRDSDIPA